MSRVVTFYSYKGGVGRTFALANVAVLLAKRGKRVLIMDWDLEAPGLHRYFKQYLPADMPEGIIHLLHKATEGSNIDWQNFVTDFSIEDGLRLAIIGSGDQQPDYVEKVRTFSWKQFFEEGDGGQTLERWRSEWKDKFDFILIDSRTGITDTGGVCTIFMPDILVLVFSTNEQSFDCGVQIVQGVQVSRRSLAVPRPPATILPLLGRFDGRDEVDESAHWLDRFARALKPFYDDWLPKKFTPRQMLEVTKVPYVTKFSFGEPLPAYTYGVSDPEFPGFYLENTARLLVSDFREALHILAPEEISGTSIIAEFRTHLAEVPIDESNLSRALTSIKDELGEEVLPELLTEAGTVLWHQGDLAAGETYLRRALLIAENTFGVQDAKVVPILTRLAELLQLTEQFSEAEELYRRSLTLLAEQSEPNPALIPTFNNLASLLRNAGRLHEAEDLYRHALVELESYPRLEDPAATAIFSNFASLLRETGRLDEAEDLYRQALDKLKQYAPNDRALLNIQNNLARVLRDRGRLSEAEAVYRQALSELKESSSLRSAESAVASTYINFGRLLRETGRLHEAESLYREALQRLEEYSRPGDRSLIAIYNNLARVMRETGRLEEAETLYREALNRLEQYSRPGDPAVATTYNNLARVLRDMHRISDAENVYWRVIQMLEMYSRSGDAAFANTYQNLTSLLRDTDRLKEAESIYREALHKLEKVGRPGDRGLIIMYRNFARMLRESGQLSEAEEICRKLINSLDKSKRRSPELGMALNDLGEVLMAQNDMREAERAFRRSLAILDPSSLAGRRATRNLVTLLERKGKKEEAQAVIKQQSFDCIIVHNIKDAKLVRQLALELRTVGVRVWLDEWELAPGSPWVESVKELISSTVSLLVCIGSGSPWEIAELETTLSNVMSLKRVIPVLLPGSESRDIPPLLRGFTAVDLREGITLDRVERLVWGITGEKPAGSQTNVIIDNKG